ncbi:hypothetical protein, partial [Pseudomonas helleri]
HFLRSSTPFPAGQIFSTPLNAKSPITDEAGQVKQDEFVALGDQLVEALPTADGDLWDALTALSDAELDTLLAFAVARSVSLSIEPKELTEKYAQALNLKMEDHFIPTVGNYLGRVSKELIIEALTEAGTIKGAAAKTECNT